MIEPRDTSIFSSRVQPFLFWIILGLWTAFFFPKWFALLGTKVSELRQMRGQDRFAQMRVLQGDELDVIQAISRSEFVTSNTGKIIVPPHGTYPLLSVVAMWRSVLGSSERLVGPTQVFVSDQSLLVPVPSSDHDWNPTQWACEQQGCECPAWRGVKVQYWEVP